MSFTTLSRASAVNNSGLRVLGFLFTAVAFVFLLPQSASAAANITLVSAQIATSSANQVLVQLDNPNATTLSSLTAASWHIDVNDGGVSASTSQTATILESSYPFTIRLTFQGPLAASYPAATGLYVDASGVTDSGSNTNTVVGHASSIAISAVDGAAPTLSPITIASNNASTTLAKSGNTVTLSVTSNKGVFTPSITIGTHSATVSRTSPTAWSASAALDGTDTDSANVSFTVTAPKSIQGVAGANVTAITSGANVMYDRTAPTITLTGPGTDSVYVSGSLGYSDQGATVSDSREAAINSALVTSGSVNRAIPGTYTLTYNASDSAGNAATAATRTVTVNPVGNGAIFTGDASSLPGYQAPRPQIIYPDGRVVYLDEGTKPQQSVSVTPAAPSVAITFSKTLSRGAQNDEVKRLQELLATDASLYPEGLVTGYFGSLTEKAVQRFQAKYDVVSDGAPKTTGYGLVGPKTRTKLAEIFR